MCVVYWIKNVNRFLSKGVCVLLFDIFNECSLVQLKKQIGWHGKECPTFTIKKNWYSEKFDFFRKKICRNALALKSKKVQGIVRETFILVLLSSSVFCLQNSVSYLFKTVLRGR